MLTASDRKHFHWVSDPRTPGSGACLGAYFTIQNPGQDPHGYGEHFDPGCGAEIDIVRILDEAEKPVALTDDQQEAVEAVICAEFDFRAAIREERERAAELYSLEGPL